MRQKVLLASQNNPEDKQGEELLVHFPCSLQFSPSNTLLRNMANKSMECVICSAPGRKKCELLLKEVISFLSSSDIFHNPHY